MRAFITHGGMSSILEAVNCGVPLVVLPHFGDQFSNAALVVRKGFGVTMLPHEVTQDNISKNLKIVLSKE